MRRADWRERLHKAIAEKANEPFDWRDANCAHLVAAGLAATIEDERVPNEWRGLTAFGLAKWIRAQGCSDAGGVIARYFPEIPAGFAQDGDIATVNEVRPNKKITVALGLFVGSHVVVRGPSGLVYLPRIEARRAFRVE